MVKFVRELSTNKARRCGLIGTVTRIVSGCYQFNRGDPGRCGSSARLSAGMGERVGNTPMDSAGEPEAVGWIDNDLSRLREYCDKAAKDVLDDSA